MNSGICLLVLGLVPCVLSNEDTMLDPCGMHDIVCLSRSTEQFLEKTCKGIPKYDIKPIDPLFIPNTITHVVDKDMGLVFRFKNLNVTGLRNQKISDFQMDTKTKSVLLKTQADLNIVADIAIEIEKTKTLYGVYHASASVLGTAMYSYDLVKNDKGEEYFVVGPETLTCEATEEPNVYLNQELQNALETDPDTVAKEPAYSKNKAYYRKQAVCKIAEIAYADVVHNIRASAKILPKSAFFTDM